ncbi:HAMP domain-containing histidine kinase [Aquihabitans sp. G128]|uniref:sensor histidine kinase n=1 Tax=Aquihabitans sp. G128 TaxID=2849779 RepID=UPI001C250C6D|nr:HAMP domain-containing sensor histidine kinase [Aquihabitans sp. G128]QXC62480.1 HAMP domain-containing histidine kinase [Aquihabitans sp. G128]
MRRRLLRAFLAVIVVGVAVLGIPLGIIAQHLVREQAVRSLDREADAIGFAIGEPSEGGGAIPAAAVRAASQPDRLVVVRNRSGRPTTVGARPGGRTIEAQVVTAAGLRITVVASAREADERAVRAWLVVAGLALAGIAVAVVLAVREAGRLGRPLDDLAVASHRLGAGDLSVTVTPVGITEVDAVGEALSSSSGRIAELVRREREFSSNASHQLRTPLTALRVRLEEAAMGDPAEMAPALRDAFAEVDRLDATITELLALARSVPLVDLDRSPLRTLLDDVEQRWTLLLAPVGRELVVEVDPADADEPVAAGPLAQVLDVLVENARDHGAGAVHVTARLAGSHLVVSVADGGPGVAPGLERAIFERHVSGAASSGVGLALARTVAQSIGGRLELVDPRRARFELYVPR